MIGQLIETVCQHCRQPLVYVSRGSKGRLYHPACARAVKIRKTKERNVRHELGPKEVRTSSRVAGVSQRETAAKLATWEAMESLLKGEEALLKPLSQQGIMALERSALLKLRKALTPYYMELKNQ